MTKSGKNAQNTPYVKYSLHIRHSAGKSKNVQQAKSKLSAKYKSQIKQAQRAVSERAVAKMAASEK